MVDIDTGGKIRTIEGDLVVAWTHPFFGRSTLRPYRATVNIKDLQIDITGDGQVEADGGSGIEGVGVGMVKCEILGDIVKWRRDLSRWFTDT